MDRILQNYSGACIRRVIDRGNVVVGEHAHDSPLLSIFVIGAYANTTELGQTFVDGPTAVLYRAGASHRNIVGDCGFEQIEIEFDADWIGREFIPPLPAVHWTCGQTARASRVLAQICSTQSNESVVRAAVRRFISERRHDVSRTTPDWVRWMQAQLKQAPSLMINDLAAELGRHPSYLGTAFRSVTGEAAAEVAARARVERAAKLLRESDRPSAAIATDAGFCDQSHMIRTFHRVLGRSPTQVRGDRAFMRHPIK